MTDIKYYRDLLKQEQRITAFQRAVARVVEPGDRVLDVGAGLGTFAFFAADAGAARVWAVDGHPIVHVATAVAGVNDYRDRVAFIRGWIPAVELPERSDVVIFEDFPPRLLDARTFRVLRWVHQGYTAPNARAIPARGTVYIAPVSSAAAWNEVGELGLGDSAYGIDWSPSREYLVNAPCSGSLTPADLAGPPVPIGVVEFDRIPTLAALGGHAEWAFAHDCPIHGVALWFDLDLGGGEQLSNAPGADPASWGHLFLPIEAPLEVLAERRLQITVEPRPLPDGSPGWLSWTLTDGATTRRGYELAGIPASLAELEALSPEFVPRLDTEGALAAMVLQLTDGKRTVRDLAQEVRRVRPDLNEPEAEQFVVSTLRGRVALEHATAIVGQEVS